MSPDVLTSHDLDAAYHEAAHAVVARAVGLPVHRVTIRDGGTGHTELHGIDVDGILNRTDPELLAAVIAELQVTLAGRAADRYRGIEPGDRQDRDRAVALALAVTTTEADRRALLAFMENWTDRLVRRLWPAIDAVAYELARRRTITGRRIEEALRSVR